MDRKLYQNVKRNKQKKIKRSMNGYFTHICDKGGPPGALPPASEGQGQQNCPQGAVTGAKDEAFLGNSTNFWGNCTKLGTLPNLNGNLPRIGQNTVDGEMAAETAKYKE
jgi:hypothetical protein